MRTLYLVSVWFHVISVIVWVGGMAFIVLALVPMLRRPDLRPHAGVMFQQAARRFRVVGWIALVTLSVTGVLNLSAYGYTFDDAITGRLFQGRFGRTLMHKLPLVALVVILSLAHDFWVGPKASQLAELGPEYEAKREKYRKVSSYLGRSIFVVALVIVTFGILLVR